MCDKKNNPCLLWGEKKVAVLGAPSALGTVTAQAMAKHIHESTNDVVLAVGAGKTKHEGTATIKIGDGEDSISSFMEKWKALLNTDEAKRKSQEFLDQCTTSLREQGLIKDNQFVTNVKFDLGNVDVEVSNAPAHIEFSMLVPSQKDE